MEETRVFKKPDLNAPRFKAKFVNTANNEFFEEFKEKYPEYASISNEDLKAKIELINGYIWNTVLEFRDGVELPSNLGYLFIGSCPKSEKTKKANINYETSKAYGKHITHRNWESDSYIGKIFYTNYEQRYNFKFHELWGFEGVRQFKRTVADTYPSRWNRYVRVDNTIRISRIFRNNNFRMKRVELTKELLKTYNEFEL